MDFSKQALSVVARWVNIALLTQSILLQVTIPAALLMIVGHLLQAQVIIHLALATRVQIITLQVQKHVDHATAQVVNRGVGDAAL